jgi:glutathione peroxidase
MGLIHSLPEQNGLELLPPGPCSVPFFRRAESMQDIHLAPRFFVHDQFRSEIYDFSAELMTGERLSLAAFQGQVLLIVNTASHCGFTPQYEELEKLYLSRGLSGLSVLGFPCNQFGAQEPGSGDAICAFVHSRFGVTFPIFAKVNVNGPEAHPLFQFLRKSKAGLFGTSSIKWNFTKFLVGRDGRVIARYAPFTRPEKLIPAIDRLLDLPSPPM